MTYTEAVGLAIMIERHWHGLGFLSVAVAPKKESVNRFNDDHYAYGVSSNLVNGLPPGIDAEQYRDAVRRRRLAEQGLSA